MSTSTEWDRLSEICAAIKQRCDIHPDLVILLGTGLGGVAEGIAVEARIDYADLPGMPVSTADSHKGEVVLGTLNGVSVVAFSGRLHCYEGYAATDVVVPVRIGKMLGAHTLVMGSAVGGMDPRLQVGQLAVIEDHINFMGVNPLVGPNDDRIGGRWPDMIEPYNHAMRRLAQETAIGLGFALPEVVYAGVLGPNLETRAEYRMLRTLGADVVGMSTVPETIAAVHCGLHTLAFTIITDRCLPDALEPADIAAIIAAANAAEPHLTKLITELAPKLGQ